jgi:hypothetical protein
MYKFYQFHKIYANIMNEVFSFDVGNIQIEEKYLQPKNSSKTKNDLFSIYNKEVNYSYG